MTAHQLNNAVEELRSRGYLTDETLSQMTTSEYARVCEEAGMTRGEL